MLRGRKLRPGGPTAASLGDMNITVGGDLQVVKAANDQVLLLGTIETVRGTYEFQGRRFDLQRGGTLRFIGEPQLNPALDVTATRTIPNTGVEARVRIQGTAKAPQLALTSNPPLEESDILALIVFNRPVNELGTGERASLAATAGGIATGFIAAPLGESIGRALDLDLFEITTTTDEGDLGRRADRRPADRRPGVLQDAPAVRRAQHHRVPARIPARRFPARAGHRGAGNVRLGQPHRPAPHRARGDRFDFLFQLLMLFEGSVGIRAAGPSLTRAGSAGCCFSESAVIYQPPRARCRSVARSALHWAHAHNSDSAAISSCQCLPSNATSTRASLKHAPPPRSVRVSGTSALEVEPL